MKTPVKRKRGVVEGKKARKPGRGGVIKLDPWRVKPFAGQPRKRFRGIDKLAESIWQVGQVTPIVVTPLREKDFDAELVDGERRLQACRSMDLPVRAIFGRDVSAGDRFALSIAANFCRQDHDCVEIAEAVEKLQAQGRTYNQIASIFGKTNTFVAQHLAIRRLHPDVQEMLKRAGDEAKQSHKQLRARGRMTLSVALLLVPLKPTDQVRAAKHIAKKKLSIAASRNYVYNLGKKRGQTLGKSTSPRQRFHVLWNQTDTYRHALARYAEAKYADWKLVCEAIGPCQVGMLVGQLRMMCDDLHGIADTLEKISKLEETK